MVALLKKHPVYILPATSSTLVDSQLILKSMEFQGERFKSMNGEKTHSHKFSTTLCFTMYIKTMCKTIPVKHS